MNTNDIDRTHIVALQEVNGMLQNVTLPISRPEQFIDELKAMIENPNRTVWDMQSHFLLRYPKSTQIKDYIKPHSYYSYSLRNSLTDLGTRYPQIKEYDELRQAWNEAALYAKNSYIEECRNKQIAPQPSEITSRIETAVSEKKKCQKLTFMNSAERWIDACCYEIKSSEVSQNRSVKMFSKENIGWNTFSHRVNDNVEVELRTNFGYGNSSHFLLAVKYKGISILPYSYIVKYYNARMADIIRCTRSYQSTRESWCAAFDFLVDFVNKSISNPESFVKTYILSEVKEMMDGLESISRNPSNFIEGIKDRTADPYIINVRSMLSNERQRMATYPEETSILFKVEKIMGALDFLNSLIEIAKEVSAIQPNIDRLIKLNMDLYPEIQNAVIKIKNKIEPQTAIKTNLGLKIASLTDKLNPYTEEIRKLSKEATTEHPFNLTNYEARHPNYTKLKREKYDLQDQIYKVDRLINDLNSFIITLNNSLSKLDGLRDKKAA